MNDGIYYILCSEFDADGKHKELGTLMIRDERDADRAFLICIQRGIFPRMLRV